MSKMCFLWLGNEKRNYIHLTMIINDIVSEGLRTIFRQEWDRRYQAILGPWDDTRTIGQQFYNLEKKRPHNTEHLSRFKSGNINKWNCTVLFDAILYSESIGKTSVNPDVRREVENLRCLTNTVSRVPRCRFSEDEFEDAREKVLNSFYNLGLQIQAEKISNIKIEKRFQPGKHKFLFFLIIFAAFLLFYKLYNTERHIFKVLPPRPPHEVVSRNDLVSKVVNDLHNLRSSVNGELTYFYISGNPGCGKSQLARQIGESYYNEEIKDQSVSIFVMTLNAKNLITLLESYEDFARRLYCTENVVTTIVSSMQTTEVKIRHLRTQIASRIKSYKSWLVIVDNVDNLNLVSPLLPQIRNEEWKGGQILITTQDSTVVPPDSSFHSHISVSKGMGPIECCHLLGALSGTGDRPTLTDVARQLDFQPLALAAAAVYVKLVRDNNVSPQLSWKDYLQKLDEGKGEKTEKLLSEINPTYSQTMRAAVLLAVQKAAEANVALSHAFDFLSLASHESLPLRIVINYVLLVDKDQDKGEVGVKIRRSSLIISEDNEISSIRLHRVVADAIRVCVNKGYRRNNLSRFHAAAKSFYTFNYIDHDQLLIPHLKIFYGAMTDMFPNNTILHAVKPRLEIPKIFRYFGSVLLNYGEFVAAKQYYERALDIDTKHLGSNHVDVAISYNNLGIVYQELGELQQAKHHCERALRIRIELLGYNHIDVAVSYNTLGGIHLDLRDLQQAKDYHERALGICIEKLGPNHDHVATSHHHLGLVHQRLGDLLRAKQYCKRALDNRINDWDLIMLMLQLLTIAWAVYT